MSRLEVLGVGLAVGLFAGLLIGTSMARGATPPPASEPSWRPVLTEAPQPTVSMSSGELDDRMAHGTGPEASAVDGSDASSPSSGPAAASELPVATVAPSTPDSSPRPTRTRTPVAGNTTVAQARSYAASAVGPTQFGCLDRLWEHESGWNTYARNASSGAYGIPQSLPGSKMATVAADWRTNPVTQVKWGIGYVRARYGTACSAWSHFLRVRWY